MQTRLKTGHYCKDCHPFGEAISQREFFKNTCTKGNCDGCEKSNTTLYPWEDE